MPQSEKLNTEQRLQRDRERRRARIVWDDNPRPLPPPSKEIITNPTLKGIGVVITVIATFVALEVFHRVVLPADKPSLVQQIIANLSKDAGEQVDLNGDK